MKKISFFLASFLLMTIVSCSEDESNSIGKTAFLFNESSVDLPVSNEGESFVEVEVGVTTVSSVDRSFQLVVDPSSTATSSQYTIDAATAVIPAGEYVTKVKVYGNFDFVPEEGFVNLVLNLDGVDGLVAGKEKSVIKIYRYCLSDLVGTYSVTTTYAFHDFLPTFATNTDVVNIFANTGENNYYVEDFSGGLYSVGPYCDNYNTCSAPLRLNFSVNCSDIAWSGQTDPWGAINMNGESTYNSSTGVLTIRWKCAGYGEEGVSVYTPL